MLSNYSSLAASLSTVGAIPGGAEGGGVRLPISSYSTLIGRMGAPGHHGAPFRESHTLLRSSPDAARGSPREHGPNDDDSDPGSQQTNTTVSATGRRGFARVRAPPPDPVLRARNQAARDERRRAAQAQQVSRDSDEYDSDNWA